MAVRSGTASSTPTRPRLRQLRALAGVAVAACLVAASVSCSDTREKTIEISVLSSRADLVTGGDALVEIVLPADVDAETVRVDDDGRDVTSEFAVRDDGRVLGLVTGLDEGVNELTVAAGGLSARLAVIDHPVDGPVLSGQQVTPWVCETKRAGLGPAVDERCGAPTRVEYVYKPVAGTDGVFEPYDLANPPGDVAETVTDDGTVVPYIVRRETGTAHRGTYQISVLDDPGTEPAAWAGPEGWNGKLYYFFDGGATAQYRQGVVTGTDDTTTVNGGGWVVLSDFALARGFAVATSTLSWGRQNTNTVTSAEALMTVKERVIEQFGDIRYTMSNGCSGGSVQQHVIADTYPGLLDGLLPTCSYPDWMAFNAETVDCQLLYQAFDRERDAWSASARDAVLGGAGGNCDVWTTAGYHDQINNPEIGCTLATRATGAEPEWVYGERNPAGARCTFWDQQIAMYGERDRGSWGPVEESLGRGFANRPLDNTGVQYGLRAVESGEITAEQFVTLNEEVGGYDIDMNWTEPRSVADGPALDVAYRAFSTYGTNLASIPIIDYRLTQNAGGHPDWRSKSMRERLVRANGDAKNQAIWLSDAPFDPLEPASLEQVRVMSEEAFTVMDEWLAGMEADDSDRDLAAKVIANKPVAAIDTCWIRDERSTDAARCDAEIPGVTNPRMVAGGPITDDVLACRKVAPERDSYATTFTDVQWDRLTALFEDGVCDYAQPGIGQQPTQTWLTFEDGPGGRPLGPAPVSVG